MKLVCGYEQVSALYPCQRERKGFSIIPAVVSGLVHSATGHNDRYRSCRSVYFIHCNDSHLHLTRWNRLVTKLSKSLRLIWDIH